jgi:hypothetical protein
MVEHPNLNYKEINWWPDSRMLKITWNSYYQKEEGEFAAFLRQALSQHLNVYLLTYPLDQFGPISNKRS